MRKIGIMTCALTSACAISLGSINVSAESQISAPAESAGAETSVTSSAEDRYSSTGILAEYDKEEGVINVKYTNPLDTLVSFLDYEILLGEKIVKNDEIYSSESGNFTYTPTKDGTYTIKVNYRETGANGAEHTLQEEVTVTGAKKESIETAEKEAASTSPTTVSNGKVSISYEKAAGLLSAKSDVKGEKVYAWYKDSKKVSDSATYTPTEEGSYYCIMTDKANSSDTSTSKTITLYKVTGDGITTDSLNGLYEAGSMVTVTTSTSIGEKVKSWKTSVKNIEITTKKNKGTFRMPNRSIKVSAKISKKVKITTYDATASKTKAEKGDVITVIAKKKDGEAFNSWDITGAEKYESTAPETLSITVGDSDISVWAKYTKKPEQNTQQTSYSSITSSTQQTEQKAHEADAKHAVYTVLNDGGYKVKVEHHSQGPLCDAAFKYAQGHDWLVTDYFNITVNDSLTTYEIPNPVKIQMTIPSDLVATGRKWRMLCISKGGTPFSFEDEDTDDNTITFSPNKFYAYAMCYSDYVPEPEPVIEEYTTITEEEPETEYEPYEEEETEYIETSTIKSKYESQTLSNESGVKSSEYSETYSSENGSYGYIGDDEDDDTSEYENENAIYTRPARGTSQPAKSIQSDKKPAVENNPSSKPTVFGV